MKNFYTDGACSGNPGPGGFGVVEYDPETKEVGIAVSRQEQNTTNNRMELSAIIYAYENCYAYNRNENNWDYINIFSDSSYCCNMINKWIWDWADKGWKNSKGKEVENIDLVKRIYELIKKRPDITVTHIKGHNGLIGNELADALATGNMTKYKTIIRRGAIEENYNFVSDREA